MSRLPSSPGVYIFEDVHHAPLYIGKSVHLRTRIRQHVHNHELNSKHFIASTRFLRLFPLSSELETILLEAKFIKFYQPPWNIIQKDDKSFLYITISKDEYPKVQISRKNDLDFSADYYGPFTNATTTRTLLKLLRRLFRFCQTPPNSGRLRACFYYHLGACTGPCVGKVSAPVYRKQIAQIKRFLNGQTSTILKSLASQIAARSRAKDFEAASELKRQYTAIFSSTQLNRQFSSLLTSPADTDQKLHQLNKFLRLFHLESSLERIECYDMATLNQTQTVGALVVFTQGSADKSQYRRFIVRSQKLGDPHTMAEVLRRRFRHPEWPTPDLVVLDGGIPQLSVCRPHIPANIPVIALAKKEETVVIPKSDGYDQIRLDFSSPALSLLRSLRDETHRFVNRFIKERSARLLLLS